MGVKPRLGETACLAFAVCALAPLRARADGDVEASYQTVVTATRTDEPIADATVTTEVIDRAAILASGAGDVAELLETMGGVEIDRGLGGAGVRLLGLDSKYTLVVIDGQRVIGRTDGVLDLSRMRLDDVERIEIVRGPASAVWGSDAIGGVINIVTRKPKVPLEAEVRTRVGSLGERELGGAVRHRGEWLSATLDVTWGQRDAFDLDPSNLSTTGSADDRLDVAGRVGLGARRSARLELRTAIGRRDLTGVDTAGGGAVFDRTNRIETYSAALEGEWRPAPATRLGAVASGSFYRDQFLLDQRGSGELDQVQDSRQALAELQLSGQTLLGGHLLASGLEFSHESLESPRLRDTGDRQRAGIYLQDEWVPFDTPRLALLPAVRLDADTQFGTHVTPRLAVRFDPAPFLIVRASAGLGYRAPDFKELYLRFENPGVGYVVEGNPDLQPETSFTMELSTEWRVGEDVDILVRAHRTDLDDLIDYVIAEDGGGDMLTRYLTANVARAHTQGLDLGLNATFADALRLSLSGGFLDTLDETAGLPLPGRSRLRASFQATWAPRTWPVVASARAAWSGERRFDGLDAGMSPVVQTAPGYVLVGGRLAVQLVGGRVELAVGVENLTDEGDAVFLPITPRTVYAALSGRY